MEADIRQAGEAKHTDVERGTQDEQHDDQSSFEFDDMASLGDKDIIDSNNDDEDSEDDDGGNVKAISDTVMVCLKLFSQFPRLADSSDTSTKSKDIIDKHPAGRVGFIMDMNRSFNLWIDYTGALAADINRSLDVRLQEHKDIKSMSVELLQMVARNLVYCVLKLPLRHINDKFLYSLRPVAESSRKDLGSPQKCELQTEAAGAIRNAIEELHFLASVIRKSSIRSQSHSLSSGFERDDDPHFENYMFLLVRHTFPHARRSLCEQVSASIVLRRKRFYHSIKHEKKLKTRQNPNRVNTDPAAQAILAKQPHPSGPQSQPDPSSAPPLRRDRPIPTSSADTRSILNAPKARHALKARPALSTVSLGSSVCISELKYPPKPSFEPGATDCACPYCARRLTTTKLISSPSFWEDHLDEDLQPYICLSEDCASPLLFFVHMREWADHMNSMHSDQWARRIHMSTWYCDTNHEAEQFNDLESFMEHMKNPDNHSGRPPPSDLQLDTLSRRKRATLTREAEYPCPFCDCIPDAIKPVIATSKPEDIRHLLHKHIANHIKDLSVLSFPLLTISGTSQHGSDKSEVKEKDQRLQEGEEASYQSGYDEELRALPLSDVEIPEEIPPLSVDETQSTYWRDIGFVDWYEAKVTISRPESDVVLQDFIRARSRDSAGLASHLIYMTNEKYTVGWICTVNIEFIAAQAFLDETHNSPGHTYPNDPNIYILGRISLHNVVIAVLAEGEYVISSAARAVMNMRRNFPNIRTRLMIGIGGGAPSPEHDIRLGDIVVGHSPGGKGGVIQYDFAKAMVQGQVFQETGFPSQPPTMLQRAVEDMMLQYGLRGQQIEEAICRIIERNPSLRKNYGRPDPSSDRLYQSHIIHPPTREADCTVACHNDPSNLISRVQRGEDDENPAIHYGLIASSNQLMKTASVRDKLAADKGILCFTGVAGVLNVFPCLVIRGICDYADSHGNKEWHGYAVMAAAAYARDLLSGIHSIDVEIETSGDIPISNWMG